MEFPSDSKPQRALVIKLGHIGDVLVTTPVLTALKEKYPHIKITMVVNQGTQAMVRHSPYVDKLLVLERKAKSNMPLWLSHLKLLKDIRNPRPDLSFELSQGDRGAFLSFISQSRFRVGYEPKKPHVRAKAFHRLVNSRGTQNHVVETFLRQISAIGLTCQDQRLKFYPGQKALDKADEILYENGLKPGAYALVHPTSRWMFKTWTHEGTGKVIDHFEKKGLPVLLTAGPAQAELDFVNSVLNGNHLKSPKVNLAGKLDLCLLGALIQKARIFWGVDSAPMHMASALGTPVAVLFGPSGEKMWGPWQVPSEVITHDLRCRPCGRDGCDGSKISRCLTELPVEKVLRAIDRLLERT